MDNHEEFELDLLGLFFYLKKKIWIIAAAFAVCAVLGFVEGFVYCVLISWVLSYLGLIIGRGTMEGTTLGRFFLLFDFITAGLM